MVTDVNHHDGDIVRRSPLIGDCMDASYSQRRRNRRAQAHSSRENLIKDSSSEASPRDAPAATALADRRRQRRRQTSSEDQQHVNPAFAADDEPALPPTAERPNDDDEEEDDEEEERIRDADRLASHVEKEHSRKVNELRRQVPKKGSASEGENEQDELEEQLRAQQQIAARKIETVDTTASMPVEPISIPTSATTPGRERSLDKVIERARRARGGPRADEDMQSTMGSSRRLAGTTDSRLQRILRHIDPTTDPSQTGTMTRPDRSTRFDVDDYDPGEESRVREDISRKQGERSSRWQEAMKQLGTAITPAEQDEFFTKVWPEEKPAPPPAATTDSAQPPPATTTDAATTDDPSTLRDRRGAEDRVPLLPSSVSAQLTQYQRAERDFDDDEELDLEAKRYKYVTGEPLTLQQKLGDGVGQPRSLEMEGFFVGKKPVVPRKVLQRAEQRIVQESQLNQKSPERWFGPDGTLVALPNPTKFVPTRPLIDELFDPALGKEFCKAFTIDSRTGVATDSTGSERYRLDIDIGSITFFHHHLMSMEHVFAMKLKQMYESYTIRRQQRRVQQLTDKIKALKKAEENCAKLFEQSRYSDSASVKELRDRLTTYQNELRQARNERCTEMKLDRQLLQRLLETWRKIKDLRRFQGFINTPVRLIIKQLSAKKGNQYEQMQKQIEDEIRDEQKFAEEQDEKALAEYNDIVKRKKLQGIRKKEAKKRLEKKQKAAATTAEDADEVEYDQADIDIVNEEEIQLPEKPARRNPDEIRTTVLAKYQNAIRPPDEPEILLELVFSEPVSTDAECSAIERARRYEVQSRSSLTARILINEKVIADTTNISLTSDFEGQFNQIFPCYVVRTPETIKIEIYETATRFRSLLAEVYLAVPESSVTTENYQLQPVEFSSDIRRSFDPNRISAVGAGVDLPEKYKDLERPFLTLEGTLRIAAAWGVQDGVALVPQDYPQSKAFQNRQMAKQDFSVKGMNLNNMKNLIEWIKQSNLDPYDPDNAFLIDLLKDYTSGQADVNTYQHFRLMIDEANAIDTVEHPVDIDNSLRFKLFQARKENLSVFKDYRRVPPYDYLVRKDRTVFQNFLKKRNETLDDDDYEQYTDKRKTRIDLVRRQGEQQLRRMREQVKARFAVAKTRKTISQIVVEESVPNIQALRAYLAKINIEPNRPLYPVRRPTRERKATNIAIAANRDVFILVNIIGAGDLPVRRAALENSRGNQARPPTDRVTLVRPYVEIQFQKKTYRTSTVDGPNPSWNEEIRIPFRPPDNDFDPSALQKCRDVLYINVFDQVDVDLPTADRQQDQVIHKRISRNWLGSVKIPFSNIYVNERLEGAYRLNVPNPLLGYARERLNQTAPGLPPASVLRMFLTMEPTLVRPDPMEQSFDSTESEQLLQHAQNWVRELYAKFPDREYKATVADTNGRSVFIPRYIRALPLPPGFTADGTDGAGGDVQTLSQRVARFVSLIPFLSDTISFPGVSDIWETSDQFLKTMAGDDEEHAVLLNNYFQTLNRTTYIAIGVSIYSGPCCFVLTKNAMDPYPKCWSVADGQDASVLDNWNPIRSIYLLANHENIWANIQQQDLPSRMNFEVENTSYWKPFFDRSFPKDVANWTSVQPGDLQYEATRQDDVTSLQVNIYEVLRTKIIEWREPHITRWNWAFQRKIQDYIKQEEGRFISGRNANASTLEDELKRDQPNYEIVGFPLQMPYTNMRSIVETVYATKVFEHPTNDIEFALAVHLHAYTNNILAVWIYLAHLTRKN